ncbi:SDR family NAD(P)-dependent oxidoreductase [Aspergillus brunneoviolaceus CBS 621.78]|uniref:NAD(P)-binding protein n=1 Tax=Aspergillus brunneoviolaceus CBS 621.78 TaxID=1450534 RepID=A0ACD1G822_9EURO|nr:NAD(P)-binding protein [Aspergillus brunneoviolaceus CBS 621.78]RAH45380.1 NAD(P)-binding protein [Aspergillus brunneoviolaceus CBS 621.78]
MRPPLPSVTPTWHNDTYPAIAPTRPELSMTGKTVIITGAGSGIGRATACAFAKAGASSIVLIGRNESKLRETEQNLLGFQVKVVVHSIDVTDEGRVKEIASGLDPWDVLILGAAFLATPSSIAESSTESWASPGAAIIPVAAATVLPPTIVPGLSAYLSPKLALIKMMEYLAAENPSLFVATLHPGMVETEIFHKSGGQADQLPINTVNLPAEFTVWLASSEASFLRG